MSIAACVRFSFSDEFYYILGITHVGDENLTEAGLTACVASKPAVRFVCGTDINTQAGLLAGQTDRQQATVQNIDVLADHLWFLVSDIITIIM